MKRPTLDSPKLTEHLPEANFQMIYEEDPPSLFHGHLTDCTISDVEIERPDFSKMWFKNVLFQNVSFENVELTDVVFENCDLSNVNFYGTNTIFDGDTIFLIKSPDSEEWSSQKASKDVEGIVFGGKK